MRFRMPPQIVRLILVTFGIVSVYGAARYVLTPVTFGQYGWYRGRALEEVASRPPVFAGRKACEECHAKVEAKLIKAEHKTVGCESCHGISLTHAENPDIKLPKLTDHDCMRCHQANVSKPKWLKQIELAKHYSGEPCSGCHSPHQPTEVP